MEKSINNTQQEKQRTLAQNKALHAYCTEIANELNIRGITQKALIDMLMIMGVDNTMFSVKRLFQIIGEAKFGKAETHRFTKVEIGEVEKEVSNLVVQVSKGEVNPVFPSQEAILWDEEFGK